MLKCVFYSNYGFAGTVLYRSSGRRPAPPDLIALVAQLGVEYVVH